MHHLIKQIFKKRKIEDVTKLTEEEIATFEKWQKVLTTKDITLEILGEFIEEQRSNLENKIADPSIPKEQRMELLPYLSIYKALSGLIKSPRVEREALEGYLKQLLNQ